MISFTSIHCPFDVLFVSRRGGGGGGGDVALAPRNFILFFKNGVAARAINKSDLFTNHLVSRLHFVRKSPYVTAGQELATLEISEDLLSCAETVHGEHVSSPDTERQVESVPAISQRDAKKLKAVLRVSVPGASGELPPHILYLLDLGFDLEQIKVITHKFPSFAYYSLEGKIKPLIEFLLDLGVPKSELPSILVRRPQLVGLRLSENIITTMEFLESLGVDKRRWPKLISHSPALISYSREKIMANVEFLNEIGLPREHMVKVLTRFPNIISYSVDDKLRPTAEYFQSLGVDFAVLLHSWPPTISLSIEYNLKPVTAFFLQNGFSTEELGIMLSRFGALYSYSLKSNVIPKWEFFLTMDYPREDLIKFPHYFSYSFNKRIKPRYKVVKKAGVKLSLSQLLSLSDDKFELLLKKRIKKLQLGEFSNRSDTTDSENIQSNGEVSPLNDMQVIQEDGFE